MGNRVCVIGAGPSGITAAKNCIQNGLDVTVFEMNDKVGGNWVFNSKTGHSSVYENTHLISSKAWSEFEDFPMPDSYPDYPNHRMSQQIFGLKRLGDLPELKLRAQDVLRGLDQGTI